jgi:hypothetical protein
MTVSKNRTFGTPTTPICSSAACQLADFSDIPHQLITPFVGRQREFEALVNAYRQATHNTL